MPQARHRHSYTTNVWNIKNDPKYAQIFLVGMAGPRATMPPRWSFASG